MAIVLFLVIVLCSMGDVIIKNIFANGEEYTLGDNHVFNAIACIIGAPVALIAYGISDISLPSMLLGTGCGICMAFVAIYGVLSFKTGPMSLTSMFGSFSMIIPILVGFLFWKEAITITKIIGILLMFISIFYITNPDKDAVITKKWVINVLIFTFTTGFMTTFQQISAKVVPNESSSFLFVTYIIATLVICFNLPFCNRKECNRVTQRFLSLGNLNGLLVGIIGAINTICCLIILRMIDSTIFYPAKAGICLICNGILGFYAFHEKLGKKQIIGFAIGIIAVIMLTIN